MTNARHTSQVGLAQRQHQAFADAHNASSMTRYYLRRGNLAAAKRKSVQALAAITQLQKLEA